MVQPNKERFDSEDLDLLSSVMEVIPNLTEVASAIKLIRKGGKYPIENRDQLLEMFKGKKSIKLAERSVEATQVEQFLPEKFFPIDSERDLICKLLIAFQIGDLYHNEESLQEESPDTPGQILPGPTYQSGAYLRLRHSKKEKK